MTTYPPQPGSSKPASLELPTEIWLVIFRLATYVPDILDPDLVLQRNRSSMIRMQRKRLRESLVTKRYLIRVCRKWYTMAMPYLYETILLGRGRGLGSLAVTLKRSSENPVHHDGRDAAIGWWTKRIDVAMRDHTPGPGIDLASELEYLAEIFTHLPNLTIINFRVGAPKYASRITLPANVLRSIAGTCGPRLLAVAWHLRTLLPEKLDWIDFLQMTPNIRTIGCPTDFFVASLEPGSSLPPLSFLKNLELGMKSVRSPINDLSSLRHLLFTGPISSWPISPNCSICLEVVSVQAEYVMDEMEPFFSMISESCPNLPRINILSYGLPLNHEVNAITFPKGIHTLGLQWESGVGQARKYEYENLFYRLRAMSLGTKLKIIQFTDEANVRDMREKHPREVKMEIEMLRGLGLVVQDHEGKLFQ